MKRKNIKKLLEVMYEEQGEYLPIFNGRVNGDFEEGFVVEMQGKYHRECIKITAPCGSEVTLSKENTRDLLAILKAALEVWK